MDKKTQRKLAETFLALHHDPKLLVLPNIWDPLGARMLERLGYPAVATASAAVAFSLGYDDGEKITFATMLDVIRRIAASIDVPFTADLERGYADNPRAVAENVRQVIGVGAVGINIEDSTVEGGPLAPVEVQCDLIRAVRSAADEEEVPIVINARTDAFLRDAPASEAEKTEETIARGRAYVDAGADCVYPIVAGNIETLKKIHTEISAPVNVYAPASSASMQDLEAAGISRLSLGPGLIKASVTAMKNVALALKNYGTFDSFTKDVVSSGEIQDYVSKDRMS
jgi:2-methylisocitrate lyase-like PEP mutase family enzyme